MVADSGTVHVGQWNVSHHELGVSYVQIRSLMLLFTGDYRIVSGFLHCLLNKNFT